MKEPFTGSCLPHRIAGTEGQGRPAGAGRSLVLDAPARICHTALRKNALSRPGGRRRQKTEGGEGPDGPAAPRGGRTRRRPHGRPTRPRSGKRRQSRGPTRGAARRGRGPEGRMGAEQATTTEPRPDRDREATRSAAGPEGGQGPPAVADSAALPCRRRGRPEQNVQGQYACPRAKRGNPAAAAAVRLTGAQWTPLRRPVGPEGRQRFPPKRMSEANSRRRYDALTGSLMAYERSEFGMTE